MLKTRIITRGPRTFNARSVTRRCLATFNWQDPLNAASLYTEEELAIQETAHSYCQERMLPRVLGLISPETFSFFFFILFSTLNTL
jgi:hypothetical protein